MLGIAGSLRQGSYNRLLLRAALDCVPGGMTLSISEELASIPPFDEDLERAWGPTPDAVGRLRRQVADADGLLIATPEYNQSIPGVLKNALDWLSRPPDEVLTGKPVAVVGASSGRWGTRLAQSALRQVLHATEALVLPRPAMYLAEAAHLFDERGVLVHGPTREQLADVLAAFGGWMDVVARDRGPAAQQ